MSYTADSIRDSIRIRIVTPDSIRIRTQTADSTHTHARTRAHARALNSPLSRSTRVSRHQKSKTNMDLTEAKHSEWQWHQLGCIEVCTSLQIDNHARTPPLSFLQTRCPSCCPTDRLKALKANVSCTEENKTTTTTTTTV